MSAARRNRRAGGRSGAAANREPGPQGQPHATPALEWAIATLGALLVASTIGFLVYTALSRQRTPPDVRLRVESVVDLENGYLVQFRATNRSRSTAAQLVIEGELASPDGAAEISEATLDYLPPLSDREGGLFSTKDPRRFDLRLRAKGYAKP
ncbi:MAG: TIGR02588 family protein [Geminicoccaceae bacterium]